MSKFRATGDRSINGRFSAKSKAGVRRRYLRKGDTSIADGGRNSVCPPVRGSPDWVIRGRSGDECQDRPPGEIILILCGRTRALLERRRKDRYPSREAVESCPVSRLGAW